MKRAPKSKLNKLNSLRARIDELGIPGFYKLDPLHEQATGSFHMSLGNNICWNLIRGNLGPQASPRGFRHGGRWLCLGSGHVILQLLVVELLLLQPVTFRSRDQ